MRSDCQEIPDGFSKEQADRAETMEAALAERPAPRSATDGCQVYWPAPYEVCGAIRDKYNELGGPNSFLLFPTSNELSNPDGVGKRSTFQNGPIYWSPNGGAHPVVNHFFAAWQRNGWEGGVLGYPTSDEIVNPDNVGRRQYFQGGTIYWKLNEAYYVAGAIRDKWGETGWEGGSLGYPTSDETKTPDGVGRFNRFDKGVVYWHPQYGAHPVSGGILTKWQLTNFEQGPYGYPTGDQRKRGASAWDQDFQGGTIGWPTSAAEGQDIDWQEDYIDDANCPGCGDDDRVRVNGPGWTDAPQPNARSATEPALPVPAGVVLDELPPCADVRPDGGAEPYIWCTPAESAQPQERARAAVWWSSALDKPYCVDLPGRQWAGDRTYQCMWREGIIELRDRKEPATPIGGLKVVQENQIQTTWNSTTWKARTVLHMTDVWGEAGAAQYAMSVYCASDATCNHTFDNSEPPRQVANNTKYVKDYTLTAPVAAGAQSRTNGFAEFTFTHAKATPITTKAAAAPSVRCDAIGNRNTQGCVVRGAEPILDMSTRNVPELAKHVRFAQASGLPGAPSGSKPLTRTTDDTRMQNNRNTTCNRIPGPRATGMQCDEYPFAATHEGGGAGGPARTYNDTCDVSARAAWVVVLPAGSVPAHAATGISMCFINGRQNTRGGGITTWFFTKNRVLEGDTFYVKG
ncbi:NucA/NucB deoxyribonuclease domain-containing protein [Nocardia brasiliensis]